MFFNSESIKQQLLNSKEINAKRKSPRIDTYFTGRKLVFIGVAIPKMRELAKNAYKFVDLADIENLFYDDVYECRMVGCMILVNKFQKSRSKDGRFGYIQFLRKNIDALECPELVELIGTGMTGNFIFQTEIIWHEILMNSDKIIEQDLAIMSSIYFVKNGHTSDAFTIINKFIPCKDKNLQKSIGMVLREIGKIEPQQLKEFVQRNRDNISRTALNYALRGFYF